MSIPRANIDAAPHIISLLDRLHSLSTAQETHPDTLALQDKMKTTPHEERLKPETIAKLGDFMRDKLIALERDKCEAVYTLLRAIGATNVVEAGTSFGVSTIYLALAVSQNAAVKRVKGKVIATEHEPNKALAARANWKEAGASVESVIELREGNILETLAKDMPAQVDFLLLDIWSPLALPSLNVVLPHLRHGAVVVTDNTVGHAEGYKELLAVLRAPEGPFRSVTLPFSQGLEMSVYLP